MVVVVILENFIFSFWTARVCMIYYVWLISHFMTDFWYPLDSIIKGTVRKNENGKLDQAQ